MKFPSAIFKTHIVQFLFSNYLIKGVAYLTQLLLIFFLSLEDVGSIRLTLSYFEFFNVICGLGLTTSLLKINATNNLSEEEKAFNLFSSITITVIFSLLLILLINFFAVLELFSDFADVNRFIQILSFTLLINSVLNLIVVDFQVANRFPELSKGQGISKILVFILFLPAVFLWGVQGYFFSVYAGFIVTLITLLIYGVNLGRLSDFSMYISVNWKLSFLYKNLQLSYYALLSNMFNVLNKYIGFYMLGFIGGEQKQFGLYSIALTFLVLLEIVTYTLQQFFIPKFSRVSNDSKQWLLYFKNVEKKSQLCQLGIFVIANTICALVTVTFFSDYTDISFYFLLISFSWLVSSLYVLKGPALISLGKTQYNFYSSAIALPIVILISYLLVTYYGVVGVALAKIVQSIISSLATFYFFKLSTKELHES